MPEAITWPADEPRGPASISNKLAHIDKGKDPDWWFKAGATLVPSLAEVLEQDVDEIRRAVSRAGAAAAGGPAGIWEFPRFPELRPLTLADDSPPPWIPTEDLLDWDWSPEADRLWWVAPADWGKSLLAAMLEAKKGWTVVRAESWRQAVQAMPDRGSCLRTLGRLRARGELRR
ncbi:MAG: hypothetical protein GY898_27760 [Proteobacteria bacterium]|nr:hypothetical protein [Pseudomonadota bacterium]